MLIIDQIKNFPKQFKWEPEIVGAGGLKRFDNIVVIGMGGSNLAAGLIRMLKPELRITEHRDYGLPEMSDVDLQNTLFVFSSYSGETEETISALGGAKRDNLNVAIISANGGLLAAAKDVGLPYVEIPEKNLHPRMALGFSFLALLKIIGEEEMIREARALSDLLILAKSEDRGREIAEKIGDRIPLIYASRQNAALAYNWKIRINETGKLPAFYNLLPELAHNELVSFGVKLPKELHNFCAIFLRFPGDHQRIKQKIDVLIKILEQNGVAVVSLTGMADNPMVRIFYSIMIAEYASYHLALKHNLDPDESILIDDFKKMSL